MKQPSKTQRILLACSLTLAILLLTPAGMVWGSGIQGGDFPMNGALTGLFGGFILTILATAFTVIAWQNQKWRMVLTSLIAFLTIDFGWLPWSWYLDYSTRPYPREELTFKTTQPPSSNISGTWIGSWTNPKTMLTESITLNLSQDENQIKGTIYNEKNDHFTIIDGKISGDQINIY